MKSRSALAFSFPVFVCLLSILVVAVSCTPAAQNAGVAPTATSAPAVQSPRVVPAATSAPSAQAPQYGGTLISVLDYDPTNFDSGSKPGPASLLGLVYQQYLTADFSHGEAGGGPSGYYLAGPRYVEDLYYPQLAESWKMPKLGVWVLQIRKGMHWQKVDSDAGRLMGGREVTADDIVGSLKRLLTAPKSWIRAAYPNVAKAITVEKTGPWEVTIKTTTDYLTSFYWIVQGGGFNALYPPEVVAKYGDVADWHNTVGTGPFILSNYTRGSSLTFVKNPDYWETDPIGPGKGDKLPYMDAYKQLIIPDISTRMAALRTAKVDMVGDATPEDGQSIIKEDPKMKYLQYMTTGFSPDNTYGIGMRTDKQNLPFKDKRVRQAMMLATDFNVLKQTLFGGQADIDNWPVNKQTASLYQPLSEMPQSVQDLYKYNPDKAKQLLAEAGYPNGFNTDVVTANIPQLTDELSLYKSMWAKVGIDLTIKPMENTAFTSMENARSYDQLVYRLQITFMPLVLYFTPYRGKSTTNASFVDDPVGTTPQIESIYNKVNQNIFVNWPNAYTAYKDLKPFLLDQAYMIPRPTPYVYTMWWPWVKNYYGTVMASPSFLQYAWIDQKLKQSMGH